MNKHSISEISNILSSGKKLLITGIGFDQRCFSILSNLKANKDLEILGISNAGWHERNHESLNTFRRMNMQNASIIGEESSSTIEIADEILNFFNARNSTSEIEFFVDVTSFSHELLSILIIILNRFELLSATTLLYVGAKEYSFNTKKEDIWLSRGIKQIRSVLGFPGIMRPSRKLHLILLAGFEVDRAAEIIIQYEPASLSIGLGKRELSVSNAHHESNKAFFDKLSSFVKNQETYADCVQHFEFSCIDPLETKRILLQHIDALDSEHPKNIVICPLNTKLSTVGASLAAIDRPDIQLCYAEALEYNIDGYAVPGDEVTVTSLSSIN